MKYLAIILALSLSACSSMKPMEPQVEVRYVQQPRDPIPIPDEPIYAVQLGGQETSNEKANALTASLNSALGYIRELKKLIETSNK